MINEEGSEERMLGVRVGSAVYLSFVLVFLDMIPCIIPLNRMNALYFYVLCSSFCHMLFMNCCL